LEKYGMTGSEVPLEEVLHLKTGVNYIENNIMLVSGEFITKPDFEKYTKIIVPEEEAYGANCIWVNDKVIVAEGYPTVEKAVKD
ncbi:N(G),N(G)-dimethylarginine dimethylaminohydrolase, partial [Streptococcus pyogenes]